MPGIEFNPRPVRNFTLGPFLLIWKIPMYISRKHLQKYFRYRQGTLLLMDSPSLLKHESSSVERSEAHKTMGNIFK